MHKGKKGEGKGYGNVKSKNEYVNERNG